MKCTYIVLCILSLFLCLCEKNQAESSKRGHLADDQHSQSPPILNRWAECLEFKGLVLEDKGWHIWGSSPIIGPEGKTHLFTARWPVKTTHEGWFKHSEIAHYVGDKPEGPFKLSDVVLKGTGKDTWDKRAPHNPAIHKVGDQYVLLYIANDGIYPRYYPKDSRIGMMTSKSLYGPWKKVGKDGLILSHPTNPKVWNYQTWSQVKRKYMTNPAFLQHPDGRFFIYYKSNRPGEHSRMGVAIADKLEGPYIHQEECLTSNKGHIEDGYAFYTEGKICLITTNNKPGKGFLFQSDDGINFGAPTMGFDTLDKYIPKKVIKASPNYHGRKFERPQVLMQDGKPTYLYVPSGVNINKGDGSACYLLKINPQKTSKSTAPKKVKKKQKVDLSGGGIPGGIKNRKGVIPDYIGNATGLVHGGQFYDLIQPLPNRSNRLEPKWGTPESRKRDAGLGIEDDVYSYWGGNPVLGNDGRYHCFVARWPENSPKGHMQWRDSTVAHTIADNPLGPWKVLGEAYPKIDGGKGHNPEVHQLKNGKWALWVCWNRVLITEGADINGKWTGKYKTKKSKDWHQFPGFGLNPTCLIRKDGSIFYSSWAGAMGVIPSGNPLDPVEGIKTRSFVDYNGGPEDPVIWKTGHQYYLMYNYWQLRLAVIMRSHDGVNWVLDSGFAYKGGGKIEYYEDGTVIPWFKAERAKILQDKHGRMTHLSLASCDVNKRTDFSDDNHSSKHMTLPMTVEGLTSILNKEHITHETTKIIIKLIAEPGFDPLKDVNVKSLTFGDPKVVNYGKGMKVTTSTPDGKDLLLTFEGDAGITEESFTGKIIGEKSNGSLYYAYPRLPGFVDDPAVLVASPLKLLKKNGKSKLRFTVKNFGLETSNPSTFYLGSSLSVKVPELKPYASKVYELEVPASFKTKNLKTRFHPKYQTF